MSGNTNHLAGTHTGSPDTCDIRCMGCDHPCHLHLLGTSCKSPNCLCKGFVRLAASHEFKTMMVSCLMVTKASRYDMAKRAIKCFEEQSYPWKELIIVSDDDLSSWGVPYVKVPQGHSLGDLRNMAIGRSNGAYVAQWDDDDWYHPERLSYQVKALLMDKEASGCTLARWMLAWPDRDLYAVSGWRKTGWEGSILARRWKIPCYPGIARGEDVPVIESMDLVVLDDPGLYIYTVHGTNTWHSEHFELIFRHASRRVSQQEIEMIKACLGNLPRSISSCLNGTAVEKTVSEPTPSTALPPEVSS